MFIITIPRILNREKKFLESKVFFKTLLLTLKINRIAKN